MIIKINRNWQIELNTGDNEHTLRKITCNESKNRKYIMRGKNIVCLYYMTTKIPKKVITDLDKILRTQLK